MSKIDKLLKAASKVTVEPQDNLDEKIIEKIKNLNEEDKKILDENFIDFLKKNNSKVYLFNRKLKENKAALIFFGVFIAALGIFTFIEYRNYKEGR
jgi:hypothetical protein